ncbi:MAG: ATP-binding protein, partial [Acutalibacteraceae bacterium]
LIYGSPGVGKTTLALSAPNPLLLDFDRGISRVRAEHRKATSVCEKYEEVIADLQSPEMKNFDTIVVDTGGSFVTFLQDWAMRIDPKVNCQKNGAISLKGFGAVKQEFNRFTAWVKAILNKHIIYVFHSEEKVDKDGNAQQRLLCEGAAKNAVWTPCDFGGYVQMIGDKRDICFSPEQEFFAKGCHGIAGHYNIPALAEGTPNDFITRLFNKAKENLKAETAALAPAQNKYAEIIATTKKMLASVTDADKLNEASAEISAFDHALTSKKECAALIRDKAKELNLTLDKETKLYRPKVN